MTILTVDEMIVEMTDVMIDMSESDPSGMSLYARFEAWADGQPRRQPSTSSTIPRV